MDNKNGFILHMEYRKHIDKLNTEEKAALLDALMDHAEGKEHGDLDTSTDILYGIMEERMDRDTEHYREVSEKRAQAVMTRWNRVAEQRRSEENCDSNIQTDTNEYKSIQPDTRASYPDPDPDPDKDIEREKRENAPQDQIKKFIPPTLHDILEYIVQNGFNNVNAEIFYSYYKSNHWKIGSEPMRTEEDWKQAIETWSLREKTKAKSPPKKNSFTDIESHNYDFAALEKDIVKNQVDKPCQDGAP